MESLRCVSILASEPSLANVRREIWFTEHMLVGGGGGSETVFAFSDKAEFEVFDGEILLEIGHCLSLISFYLS
jgi:hypothetical protein